MGVSRDVEEMVDFKWAKPFWNYLDTINPPRCVTMARWRGGAVAYSGSTKRNRICVKAPGSLIRRGSSNINIFHRHGFPVVRGTESILEFYEADFVFCEHLAR